MFPENDIVVEMNHIHDIFWVILFQKLKNFKLNSRLIHILLLVLDNLHSHLLPRFMIKTFQSRSERPLAQERLNFKSIPNVIIRHNLIVSLFVVITVIVLLLRTTLHLLSSGSSNKIDFWIVQNFSLLVWSELILKVNECFLGSHGEFGLLNWRILGLEREICANFCKSCIWRTTVGSLIWSSLSIGRICSVGILWDLLLQNMIFRGNLFFSDSLRSLRALRCDIKLHLLRTILNLDVSIRRIQLWRCLYFDMQIIARILRILILGHKIDQRTLAIITGLSFLRNSLVFCLTWLISLWGCLIILIRWTRLITANFGVWWLELLWIVWYWLRRFLIKELLLIWF